MWNLATNYACACEHHIGWRWCFVIVHLTSSLFAGAPDARLLVTCRSAPAAVTRVVAGHGVHWPALTGHWRSLLGLVHPEAIAVCKLAQRLENVANKRPWLKLYSAITAIVQCTCASLSRRCCFNVLFSQSCTPSLTQILLYTTFSQCFVFASWRLRSEIQCNQVCTNDCLRNVWCYVQFQVVKV